jgi:hypothetical protein
MGRAKRKPAVGRRIGGDAGGAASGEPLRAPTRHVRVTGQGVAYRLQGEGTLRPLWCAFRAGWLEGCS